MALTLDEIEEDFWAHHYFENPSTNSFEDDDFDVDAMVEAMESDDWETVINERR